MPMARCAEIPMPEKKSPRVSKVKQVDAPVGLPWETPMVEAQLRFVGNGHSRHDMENDFFHVTQKFPSMQEDA